ncbi:MAG: putative DNA binding domain-containing protein [Flavobacteriales bacterium]|nr:putative DNA binding domain-containing protein [Flavobacteriales bacterium]
MNDTEALAELDRLLQSPGEHEVLEFKTASEEFDFDKLGKYFSAFCNEANLAREKRAWLVLGVEPKKHAIVGTQYKNSWQKLRKLKKDIGDKITDRITFMSIHEVYKDGKRVLLFDVPPAPRGVPVAYDGHYYGRDHESLVPLNPEKYERIRSQLIQEDWSATLVPGATFLDLDPAAIEKAKIEFRKKFPDRAEEMDRDNWSDLTFLNKAKLTSKGNITRAALILLGSPEAEHFLSPADVKIRWKLKNEREEDVDHAVLGMPLILAVDTVFNKIRHLKYRYMREPGSIFPEEVDKYEPFTIREALNNCIAHQDYTISGRINVIELPDQLVFTNRGSFIPGSVERTVLENAPEEKYRNTFLAAAMVQVNMVETAGGGIRKMFLFQRDRLFPMPEYTIGPDRVEVSVTGKVLDLAFAAILARNRDLTLEEIILLDKVQKHKPLTEVEVAHLRVRQLIEGRMPNVYLSLDVAQKIQRKADYTKNRGLDKKWYVELLCAALIQHKHMNRVEINDLLLEKLPDSLDARKKVNKVTNLLTELRKKNLIRNAGTRNEPRWVLCKPL